MRIMTTNIWGDYFGNPVDIRLAGILSVYEAYDPDVIGLQEITPGWYNSKLFAHLSEKYRLIGTKLSDNFNFVPMAVKKEYQLLADGYEFLFETPDVTKAITWAVLTDPESGKTFAVCNTHFWWMYIGTREHDAIREKNAHQLSCLMKYLHDRFACPVFAFGDMNTTCSSGVFEVVYPLHHVEQLFTLAAEKDDVSSYHGDPVADEKGFYHGKTTENDHTGSIDHIIGMGEGYRVKEYRIVTDQPVLDATDHSPVYADIEWL